VSRQYVASRYNFCVPVAGGSLLYNVSTGRMTKFAPGDGEELARYLGSSPQPAVDGDGFPADVWQFLLEGGFVVAADADEVGEIRRRFWEARVDAPLVVTLTVTQDCNLRCFYCYEDRSSDRLESTDVDRILARLDQSIARSSRRAIHLDWYGGEPLLNAGFIEYASERIQAHVASRGLGYSASIISNGTGWPDDPLAFVRRHAIREVQISFDGDQEQHDRYRAFRTEQGSSFEQAVRVVDAVVAACKVSVRLNLDRRSARSIPGFLDFAITRGWFRPPNRGVLQPARLAAFSKRSSFMESTQLSVTEFEEVKQRIRQLTAGAVAIEEAETIDGFPRPRRTVCAALGSASFVVGADVREYRCGLQVGETGRDVGSLGRSPRHLPIVGQASSGEAADRMFWEAFDPTTLPRCSRCSFLPVCWGGCPKGHLERNQHAIDEHGRYWRENLARLIATGVGESVRGIVVYDEKTQLRV
jgi:uncharacterized protein